MDSTLLQHRTVCGATARLLLGHPGRTGLHGTAGIARAYQSTSFQYAPRFEVTHEYGDALPADCYADL